MYLCLIWKITVCKFMKILLRRFRKNLSLKNMSFKKMVTANTFKEIFMTTKVAIILFRIRIYTYFQIA